MLHSNNGLRGKFFAQNSSHFVTLSKKKCSLGNTEPPSTDDECVKDAHDKYKNLSCNDKKPQLHDTTQSKLQVDQVNNVDDFRHDTSSDMLTGMSHVTQLMDGLHRKNDLNIRCQNVMELVSKCHCKDFFSEIQNTGDLEKILKLLSDSHTSESLCLCHSLLLCILSKNNLEFSEIKAIEESTLLLIKSSKCRSKYGLCSCLTSDQQKSFESLVPELFFEGVDAEFVNVSTLCCATLKNLSDHAKDYSNEIGISYVYSAETLKFIIELTGKFTQEIISDDMKNVSESNATFSTIAYVIGHCLQILEYALHADLDGCNYSIHHERFSLPRCLTTLLEWCIMMLFDENVPTENHASDDVQVYLSILLPLLKVLSCVSYNPDYYSTFKNVKGLMESLMVCALKTFFESGENHFDILLLCLESLINFYLKNKNIFALLCWKKFQVNPHGDILAIEGLIKIFSINLTKIKDVQNIKCPETEEGDKNEKPSCSQTDAAENTHMQLVLEAADKDMELNTLCSYISILLVFFMNIKQSCKKFVQEKLATSLINDAALVCRKVLEFASLTGGMSDSGKLILQNTIDKLEEMVSSIVKQDNCSS